MLQSTSSLFRQLTAIIVEPTNNLEHTTSEHYLGSTSSGCRLSKGHLEAGTGSGARVQYGHTNPTTGSLVSINAGLPALPTKLLNKIWANEYIDFAELPPARSKPRSLPHYLKDQVLLAQMHELDNSRKAIPDFTTWTQYFTLYSAVILLKQPDRVADLMAYFFATADNARKYRWPSWIVYDQNFRQLMEDTQDKVWAKTNPSIFTRSFIHAQKLLDSWCRHCHSVDHMAIECPHSSPAAKPNPKALPPEPKKGSICQDFNNAKGKGYTYMGSQLLPQTPVLRLPGAHPRFKCPTKKKEIPSTPGRDARPNQQ